MKKFAIILFLACVTVSGLSAAEFESFTGQVTRPKVRLRTGPSLDSKIVDQITQGEVFLITGEEDDFYAVTPPNGTKAYVYRTYILDGKVEGNRVNVRLEPSTEAPVLTQLAQGQKVDGSISSKDRHWLEIDMPSSARFYIAKEYIDPIGDANQFIVLNRKRSEAFNLLAKVKSKAEVELAKPIKNIQIEPIFQQLQTIVRDYPEFPEATNQAKELLLTVQDEYLEKRLSANIEDFDPISSQPAEETKTTEFVIETSTPKSQAVSPTLFSSNRPDRTKWLENENRVFTAWAQKQSGEPTKEEFYQNQSGQAVQLRGILEAYDRPVNNKPGDYVLINAFNQLPVAYLYSTKVDLGSYEGREVSIRAVKRPNNEFAFPAYFVIEVE